MILKKGWKQKRKIKMKEIKSIKRLCFTLKNLLMFVAVFVKFLVFRKETWKTNQRQCILNWLHEQLGLGTIWIFNCYFVLMLI